MLIGWMSCQDDLLVWGDTHLRIAQMDTGTIMFEQSAETELIRCFEIMPRTGRVITGSYSNQVGVGHRSVSPS
jgi:hypothetical protein